MSSGDTLSPTVFIVTPPAYGSTMPDREVDRAIDGLARRQHGVFHRRQAVRIGCTPGLIRTRLATGRWVRLRGSQVFGLPSHPGTWQRQAMAATLHVPGSALSGAAAAAALGFPGWRHGRPEVVTRHGSTNRSPFGVVRQSATVGRLTVVDGIRIVSSADCLVQLAPELGAVGLGALLDDVGTTDRNVLHELRERYVRLADSRLPGIADVRSVLDARGDGTVPPSGVLGRKLRQVFAGIPSLPPVEWEATLPWLERGRGRVDAVIHDWQLVVEADGRAWHTRVEDFERDRWRDNLALAHGYATTRWSWQQLTTQPTACRNVLVAIGARRSGSRCTATAV
jgi:hypothetical protein